ncbi:aldehyde-activating protein [Pectobacterium brasiliense]|uniref:Aldehyde-activating protein n=2 Tax=Pectobacterium brasiliense TaxID=180957 RepID=A0A0M2F7Q5_9GAMM|nr:GFA family protein [Pectobacterium brasiliense]KGA36512.1 aldehyde-activating protein [Pectobacterium brasiliense]
MNQGCCLCGGVKISTTEQVHDVTACHCGMCQTWGGGPFMAVECKGTAIAIDGEENIVRWQSSAWAERAFCRICGTHLFYQLRDSDIYEIPAGFFSDEANKTLVSQIYIDKKPGYYSFAEKTPTLTEQDIIALYSSHPEEEKGSQRCP